MSAPVSFNGSSLFRLIDNPSWSSNRAAWDRFLTCYTPIIYGWCRTIGLSEEDAQDMTQTILMNLPARIRKFQRSQGDFRGWLYTVTHNACLDMLRRRHVRAQGGSGSHDALAQQTAPPGPEVGDDASWQEIQDRVREGTITLAKSLRDALLQELREEALARLEQLSARDCAMYAAYEFDRKSAVEVGQVFSLSPGTVANIALKVRKLLRAEMKRLAQERGWEELLE